MSDLGKDYWFQGERIPIDQELADALVRKDELCRAWNEANHKIHLMLLERVASKVKEAD